MEQRFGLSKSNLIYFGIVAILHIALFVAFSQKSAYLTGELIGKLIALLLFPALFARLAWALATNKKRWASVTFNVVLTLFLFGQLGQAANRGRQAQQLAELEKSRDRFKADVAATDDPDQLDAAYKDFVGSVKGSFDRLSEGSTGSERRFYQIMKGFVSDSEDAARKWNDAYNAVLAPDILDYGHLSDDQEYDRQRGVLTAYVEVTRSYLTFFAGMMPDLEQRLAELGENELAKGALKGAEEKYRKQQPVFEPLMQTHVEYGLELIEVLDLLQANAAAWSMENDELVFDDGETQEAFGQLLGSLINKETTIETLSNKLVAAM